MGGLAKGLAIIEMFGHGHERMTVAEAARGSATTRAAARRCLLTLVQLGYLEHDGKFFTARPRLRRLGGRATGSSSMAELAQPILGDICDLLNEPISLAVLENGHSLFIARAEATRIVSTGVRLGGRLPAYCSATGRLLLGTLDDNEIWAYLGVTHLVPKTRRSLTDPADIFAAIIATRETGVCYSDEELELGMRSMAVAVRNGLGETIAAVSLSTSSARVSLETMQIDYLRHLLGGAHRLTEQLRLCNC
jgi:IclR family transcriptional regulator, pca regulon regulatory protein